MISTKTSCISGSLTCLCSIASSLKLAQRELVVVPLLMEQSEFLTIMGGAHKVAPGIGQLGYVVFFVCQCSS